ncbi:LCP family protein [Paenibacillus macerans]|uniref:LCP family protein n=1 Tax=Paenibacillus macerans TaxID=44252 RepID=UPI003D31BDE3
MNKDLASIELHNKKKRRRRWFWIPIVILLVLLGSGIYIGSKMMSYKHVPLDATDEELGIHSFSPPKGTTDTKSSPSPSTIPNEGKIMNIALFGTDNRDENERGRSDTMIILTLDFQLQKVKIISLMRDLWVPIDSHGFAKLNAAYAYGGPKLAIKTINQVFGTDIRDYISVDFFVMEKVINSIGGIQIDIKPEEVIVMNQYISEISSLQKKEPDHLTNGGTQTLNGIQAVAYSRVRYVGNGDFERTERQRRVLKAIEEKMNSMGVAKIPSLLMQIMPDVETSLSRSELLTLGYQYFQDGPMTTEEERFPIDGSWKAGRTSGAWIMEVDLEEIKEQAQHYIYEDVKPSLSR